MGLGGLKQIEAKLASYHNTPFTKLCLGMTRNDVTNWILVNYAGFSLYSLVADGNYRRTNAGRQKWKSLVNGASLQEHCNREGFNVMFSHHELKLRIGIAGNNENDCSSCDSVLGFGFDISQLKGSSGELHAHGSQIHTFGYIFIQ